MHRAKIFNIMKETLRKLIQETYGEFPDEETKTKTFLEIYKMLSEVMDRDFEHAWQIIIRGKKNVTP